MDKYHTICAKCQAEIAYLHAYCDPIDEKWYCSDCYKEKYPFRKEEERRGAFGAYKQD